MDAYIRNKIENLSFISIVFVVFIHAKNLQVKYLDTVMAPNSFSLNYFIQNFIAEGVSLMAVPLFFIISGYLFFVTYQHSKVTILKKYKSRFFSLVIPYLFWSLFGLFMYFVLESIPIAKVFFTHKLIVDYSWQELLYTIFIDPIPVQLWFLRALIVFVIVSPVLYTVLKKAPIAVITLFCGLWLFNISDLFFATEGILFFQGFFFYIIGAYIAIKKIELKKFTHKSLFFVFITLWLSLVLWKLYADFYHLKMAGYILRLSLIPGILTFWLGYDLFASRFNDRYHFLTRYTFFIFCFHEPVLTIIKKGLVRILPSSQFTSVFIYFFSTFLIISLSIVIAMILKRYAKPFFKLVTGGRG